MIYLRQQTSDLDSVPLGQRHPFPTFPTFRDVGSCPTIGGGEQLTIQQSLNLFDVEMVHGVSS